MTSLYSATVSVESVTEKQRQRMFSLLQQYYECSKWEYFIQDLDAKDDVILLQDKKTHQIQGFSTLKNIKIEQGGKKSFAVFSGDTVIDRAFWGERLLGKAFLKYLFMQKAKHPFRPFYWILISKGYKTYLLMANNFHTHYPRYEREPSPDIQRLMDAFAENLFGSYYDSKTGLIKFPSSRGQLRPGIADIPPDRLEHPRIKYFEQRNPNWSTGIELMCLAKMTWSMPLYYQCKSWWKLLRRTSVSTEAVVEKIPKIQE